MDHSTQIVQTQDVGHFRSEFFALKVSWLFKCLELNDKSGLERRIAPKGHFE